MHFLLATLLISSGAGMRVKGDAEWQAYLSMMMLSRDRALDPVLLDCRLDNECGSKASSSLPPA